MKNHKMNYFGQCVFMIVYIIHFNCYLFKIRFFRNYLLLTLLTIIMIIFFETMCAFFVKLITTKIQKRVRLMLSKVLRRACPLKSTHQHLVEVQKFWIRPRLVPSTKNKVRSPNRYFHALHNRSVLVNVQRFKQFGELFQRFLTYKT